MLLNSLPRIGHRIMLYVLNSFNYSERHRHHTYLDNEIVCKELQIKSFETPFLAFTKEYFRNDYFELIAINDRSQAQSVLSKDECQSLCNQFILDMVNSIILLHEGSIQIPSWLTGYVHNQVYQFDSNRNRVAEKVGMLIQNLRKYNRKEDEERIELLKFIQCALKFQVNYSNELQCFLPELEMYLGKKYIENRFNGMFVNYQMRKSESWLVFAE